MSNKEQPDIKSLLARYLASDLVIEETWTDLAIAALRILNSESDFDTGVKLVMDRFLLAEQTFKTENDIATMPSA